MTDIFHVEQCYIPPDYSALRIDNTSKGELIFFCAYGSGSLFCALARAQQNKWHCSKSGRSSSSLAQMLQIITLSLSPLSTHVHLEDCKIKNFQPHILVRHAKNIFIYLCTYYSNTVYQVTISHKSFFLFFLKKASGNQNSTKCSYTMFHGIYGHVKHQPLRLVYCEGMQNNSIIL